MNTINFTLVYNQNFATILNYCTAKLKNTEIAEEVANDVFIKFQRHLTDGLYNPDLCAIKTYLFTICNSAIIDQLRSQKNNTINIESYVDNNGNEFFSISDDSLNASDRMIDNEFYNKIQKSFDMLKPNAKRVAELYFLEQKKYVEIAEICNISLNNVKVTILRAREVLQIELIKVKKEYCR